MNCLFVDFGFVVFETPVFLSKKQVFDFRID